MRKLLSVLSFILLVTAVGSARAQTPPPPTEVPSATPLPVVPLLVWYSPQILNEHTLQSWVEAFQRANPDVQVQPRAVEGDLQAEVLDAIRRDQGPDLFLGSPSWLPELVTANRIAPLNTRIDQATQDRIAPIAWKSVTYNDTLYGIPVSAQSIVLYYNASLVEDSALPKTAEDLLALKPDLMFDFYNTAGLYAAMAGTLLDTSGKIAVDQQVLIKYLRFLKDAYAVYRKDGIINQDRPPAVTDARFRDKKTPFLIDGNWKAADLQEYLGTSLKVAPLPPLSTGKAWQPLVQTYSFFLNINANQPDAAIRFLKYITSVEAQAKLPIEALPVNPKADNGALAAVFQAQQGVPVRPEMRNLWGMLDDSVFSVTARDGAPEQAAADFNARLTAYLRTTPTPVP